MTTEWTVLSWNVLADAYVRASYYPRTPREVLAPGARTAGIVGALVASDADVICLQEVEPGLLDAARAALPGHDARYARKREKPEGCALLARRDRVAIAATTTLTFADGAPDRADSGHVALLADARVDGRRVGIATTHLRWDPPGTPSDARWAIRELRELLAATRTGEWIVCGDLNITPEDEVYASLMAAGFCDPFAASLAPTANPNGRARRIDHLLHTGGLGATALPCLAIDDATPLPSPTAPSDHLAIGARLRFVQGA